ncbi:hypothetical protein AB0395_15575 [Streptosporangium sp. NPDC051023]|uniref:hypothetical protein n=1 Tax=Streptosporangium sp. NPDC051023 TaxID=3155410 RepID=UPI0034503B76
MPNGKIFMTRGVLRDLKTGSTYDIPQELRTQPVGTLVTYTLASPRAVGSITPGLTGMIIANNAVDDEAGLLVPLKTALRGAYPDRTRVRFYGTADEVSGVDALQLVIGAQSRRVDLMDPAESAPSPLSSLGVSIEQDAQDKTDFDDDQLYYHVGAGSAWTTRIHTCTVLAMWSRTAKISYLSHADSSTSSQTIAQHMGEFFTAATSKKADLTATGELSIVLFTAKDTLTSKNSSLESILHALDLLSAAHTRAVYERARCHIAGPSDAIVVSTDAPPKVLLAYQDHLKYLLNRYAIYGEQNIRGFLIGVLQDAMVNAEFEPDAYEAAKKAKTQNDRDLYLLLAALVGYDEKKALERWDW